MGVKYNYLKKYYPKVAKAFKDNVANTNTNFINFNYEVIEAFSWHESPEGSNFWELINYGHFNEAKKEYPKLFGIPLKHLLKKL